MNRPSKDENKRPETEKQRLELWHNDDKQLSELLDNLDHKVFNINSWQFRLSDKYLTFEEFASKLKGKYPDLDIAEALKDNFLALPEKFKIIKQELFTVFKRFTLNLQERLGYIEQLEKYADHVENKNKELLEENETMKKQNYLSDIRKEIEGIKELISPNKEKPKTEKEPTSQNKEKPETKKEVSSKSPEEKKKEELMNL